MPKILIQLASVVLLAGCGQAWNDPYPAADAEHNVLYAAFTDRPKHLDPAQSYTEDEITFTGQIYEPPLQYHYLKRPYALIPPLWSRCRSPASSMPRAGNWRPMRRSTRSPRASMNCA